MLQMTMYEMKTLTESRINIKSEDHNSCRHIRVDVYHSIRL